MDMMALIAAFGGGLIGAYMGALPAFILTGVVAMAGGVAAMAGAADVTVGFVAFGSFLGPHVAFAGGVAAAAFAANKRHCLESGTDILSSLNGTADPAVLAVGGIFGVLGFLIHYVVGAILGLPTDHPGITVLILAVVTRLLLGSSGLIGKYEGEGKRVYFTMGRGLVYNILLGGGIGIAVGFVAQSMVNAGVSDALMGSFPIVCFGFSAITLIFTQTGFAMPATHHITLPAASAAVMSGNPLMGVLFGIIACLIGDFVGNTFNSHCDSHIDPPATTIALIMFPINLLFA